ncbi:unnamed protein product, partial [Prorocentrum cordatum]
GAVAPELLAALWRSRAPEDVLVYGFFLLLAEVPLGAGASALPTGVLALRERRVQVRDALALAPAGARVEDRYLLLVQPLSALRLPELEALLLSLPGGAAGGAPGVPGQNVGPRPPPAEPCPAEEWWPRVPALRSGRYVKSGMSLAHAPGPRDEALEKRHWRDTHLEAMRRFPRFFQARAHEVKTPPLDDEELQRVLRGLLLHDFAIRSVSHAVDARKPRSEASIVVCGVGRLLAHEQDPGVAPGAAAGGPQSGVPAGAAVAPAGPAPTVSELCAGGPHLPPGSRVLPAPAAPQGGTRGPEISVLVVFEDAARHGMLEVARELLLANGFFVLADRSCRPRLSDLCLLLGIPPPTKHPRDPGALCVPQLSQSLQGWLEYLKGAAHHMFVVRRHDAVALLLQLCFGASVQRAGSTPPVLRWPFVDISDAARPAPPPLFTSLHGLLRPAVIAQPPRATFAALLERMSRPPLGLTLLQTTGDGPMPLEGSVRTIVALAPLSPAATAAGAVAEPTMASAALCTRLCLARELRAFGELRSRRARGLCAPCALFEAWEALLAGGAVVLLGPPDVDALVAALWPHAAGPRSGEPGTHVTIDFAGRCIRWSDPRFGIGSASGALPAGVPRQSLAPWQAGLLSGSLAVPYGSSQGPCPWAADLLAAGVQLRMQLVQRAAGEDAGTVLSVVVRALRMLALAALVDQALGAAAGHVDVPGGAMPPWAMRRAAVLLPRGAGPEAPACSIALLRDGPPWQGLPEFPEAYTIELTPVVAALQPAELATVRLDGVVVREDAAGGKVGRGWHLRGGGDVPCGADAGAAELAAAFAALQRQPPARELALVFGAPRAGGALALVPAQSVLASEALSQAARSAGSLPAQFPIARSHHATAEALLLGACLARLAAATERAPVGAEAAEVACNEPARAVVELWRAVSSEAPVENDEEYWTRLFLSLSCYGGLVASHASCYLSLEALPSCDQLLVRFTSGGGAPPAAALWGPLPVLAKPGRLAAQLLLVLRLDAVLQRGLAGSDLGKGVHQAFSDGFVRAYCAEAPDPVNAKSRLHLHCALCLLELLWALRCGGAPAEELRARLPAEPALRDALREEVLNARGAHVDAP